LINKKIKKKFRNVWKVFVAFGWRVWHHLTVKIVIPERWLKCLGVIYTNKWRVYPNDGQSGKSDPFFFLSYSIFILALKKSNKPLRFVVLKISFLFSLKKKSNQHLLSCFFYKKKKKTLLIPYVSLTLKWLTFSPIYNGQNVDEQWRNKLSNQAYKALRLFLSSLEATPLFLDPSDPLQ
jgi:hypothetical protein